MRAPHDIKTMLIGALAVLASSSAPAQDDPVRAIDALALQWTGLEQQRHRLEADWRTQKPLLEQRLALLEREAAELSALLEASSREQGEVEEQRLELLEVQTRLEREQDALQRTLNQAATTLRALHPQLPPPLVAAWDSALPRLDDSLATATEKLQVVLELLGQLDDFARRITLHETVMTLGDGRDYAVEQVFLGVSHGWYVSADQRLAGAGRAGPDGWQWTPFDDGRAVARIVAILERRADPALVSILLELGAPPGGLGD